MFMIQRAQYFLQMMCVALRCAMLLLRFTSLRCSCVSEIAGVSHSNL